MPERVQLRRTRGWKMPPNTVSVARPTRWGNPWAVGSGHVQVSGEMRARSAGNYGKPYDSQEVLWYDLPLPGGLTAEQAVYLYREDLLRQVRPEPLPEWWGPEAIASEEADNAETRAAMVAALETLRGKNLACWCPLGQPCHADVLLELANA